MEGNLREAADRWAAVGGLFVLSAAAAAYEIAPASVTLSIMGDLGISEPAAGWLVSIMYLVSVLAGVPAGVTLDRANVPRVVTAASALLLVAGAAGWVVARDGQYLALLATRMLGGVSYAVIWNAGADLAGRVGPADSRATAVGVFTASAPAGFALGQFGGPLVAGLAGWPVVFPVFGGLAVFGIVLYRWGADRTAGGEGSASRDVPSRAEFLAVFRTPAVWTVCGMGLAAFALYLFLNSWLPTFLVEQLSVTAATSGLLTALFPAVGIVARTGSGVVSDRIFGGRRRPVTLLSFGLAGPLIVGLLFVDSVGAVVALLVAAGTVLHLVTGLLFSYIRGVVPESVAATAVSLLTSVGLLGAFLAPITAGAIREATGAFEAAFFAAGAVAVLGTVLAFVAPEP